MCLSVSGATPALTARDSSREFIRVAEWLRRLLPLSEEVSSSILRLGLKSGWSTGEDSFVTVKMQMCFDRV